MGHLPLDARRAVYLVRVGAQVFVIGMGESGMLKLGEIPASDLPETAPPVATFGDIIARVRARRGPP